MIDKLIRLTLTSLVVFAIGALMFGVYKTVITVCLINILLTGGLFVGFLASLGLAAIGWEITEH